MHKESFGPLLYVPFLHRELLPSDLPACVRPVWPGLPARMKGKDGDGWREIPLPYSPAEAASCLADLSHLDDAGLASLAATPAVRQAAGKELREREALRRFARSGDVSGGENDEEEARRWAQRFLLLGWLQEEHVLEMDQLAKRYRAGAKRLAEQLDESCGEGQGAEAFSGLAAVMRDLIPEDRTALLPSWRFMLELFGILLPPDAVACTADTRIIAALNEAGIKGQPLEALRGRLPETWNALEAGAAWVEEPLWRLLGVSSQPDRPWLDRRLVMILLQ